MLKLLFIFLQAQNIVEEQINYDYIFLHTRIEDIVGALLGFISLVLVKFWRDNGRFEVKIKHAKENPITFRNQYHQNPDYYAADPDWNWKQWWKDNDQYFVPSLFIGIFLAMFIPEAVILILNKTYSPFWSFMMGSSPLAIFQVIQEKAKSKIDNF